MKHISEPLNFFSIRGLKMYMVTKLRFYFPNLFAITLTFQEYRGICTARYPHSPSEIFFKFYSCGATTGHALLVLLLPSASAICPLRVCQRKPATFLEISYITGPHVSAQELYRRRVRGHLITET